jgi:hypothetical protein
MERGTVNPAKHIRFWKLHPAKRARGQRTYVHLKSVYGVYKSLRLLTDVSFITLHLALQSVICKPGEAYTLLKTASCEAGQGTTHICTFEICIWSLQILEIADRCAFYNSTFGFSKCPLYIEIMKNLNLSWPGSNHHPLNSSWSVLVSKASPAGI